MKYELNVFRVIPMDGRSNKPVPNQYIIQIGADMVFQSYNSVVAEYDGYNGKITINNEIANYSITTKKYLNQFIDRFSQLNNYREEIKKAIKSGKKYTVIDFRYSYGISVYNED